MTDITKRGSGEPFLVIRLFILLITFSLLLSACGTNGAERVSSPSGQAASQPIYRVTKGTGLYDAFDVDAKMIAELSVGTKLVPQDERTALDCDSITEQEIVFILCKVEVVGTGQEGWVLKKWIEME